MTLGDCSPRGGQAPPGFRSWGSRRCIDNDRDRAAMKTILSHANLIDCVEPQVRPDTAVLIEDGRIRAILPSGEAGSAGAQMIDLKGGYLMPGLWDVHIHP